MKCRNLMVGVALVLANLTGCGGGSSDVEVIDLNRVLDIMIKVLEEPLEGDAAAKKDAAAVENATGDADLKAVDPAQENKTAQAAFLKKFGEELNNAKLVTSHVGVHFKPDGAVEGFADNNKDGQKDALEPMLFVVEVDAERSRLIASDGENHRPASYRPRFGFFSGYMLGSMLGRQNNFYSGSAKPDFGSRQMAPTNYHSTAVSKARARVSSSGGSARSRSGSGGFSFGK